MPRISFGPALLKFLSRSRPGAEVLLKSTPGTLGPLSPKTEGNVSVRTPDSRALLLVTLTPVPISTLMLIGPGVDVVTAVLKFEGVRSLAVSGPVGVGLIRRLAPNAIASPDVSKVKEAESSASLSIAFQGKVAPAGGMLKLNPASSCRPGARNGEVGTPEPSLPVGTPIVRPVTERWAATLTCTGWPVEASVSLIPNLSAEGPRSSE